VGAGGATLLWGLSIAAVSAGTGVVLLAFGVALLIWGRRLPMITIPVPKLGEVQGPTGYGVLVLAVALILVPIWRADRPERLSISGRITFPAGRTLSSVVVSIVPSSHTTLTLADGTYSVRIPKGEDGMQYQAFVYAPNTNPPDYYIGVVRFDGDGRGNFDYVIKR